MHIDANAYAFTIAIVTYLTWIYSRACLIMYTRAIAYQNQWGICNGAMCYAECRTINWVLIHHMG